MKHTQSKIALLFSVLLVFCLVFSGCDQSPSGSYISRIENTSADNTFSDNTFADDTSTDYTSADTKGSRDNTSVVLTPEATGATVFTCDSAIIDASNVSEGYIMANYTGTIEKVKLQIQGPDGIT